MLAEESEDEDAVETKMFLKTLEAEEEFEEENDTDEDRMQVVKKFLLM